MTLHDDHAGPRSGLRRLATVLLAGALLGASCAGDDGQSGGEPTTSREEGPNLGAVPTLAGGIELAEVEPVAILAGANLAYGQPLPSEQAAADAFLEDPEVASVLARRVYSLSDGRLLGDALVLALDGSELFDQDVLDGFLKGVVEALGGGDAQDAEVGGRRVVRSKGAERTVAAYLEGNLLMIVRGDAEGGGRLVDLIIRRQLAALAAGVEGLPDPTTPLVPLAIDAAFVRVPTVAFKAIPPPEEEPEPESPTFSGATAVQGRYGVVAGERRTTVWAFTLDPVIYPWAEALEPALAALASARADGAAVESGEVLGHVVHRADAPVGGRSVRTFRHEGLALLVEGTDAAQLDAVVSAWIAALNPG